MNTSVYHRSAISLVLLCIMPLISLCLTGKGFRAYGDNPDFAFPEKVYKSAEADLKAALKAKDGKATVNALIRSGLAKAQINTDSLQSILNRVDQIQAAESDKATKALLNALSATIYAQLYSDDSYLYRNRTTVASDVGGDYKQWSRKQFLEKITMLVDASLVDADLLAKLPITDFQGIVTVDRDNVVCYPTLLDFIALNGISNLKSLILGNSKVLNSELLQRPTDEFLFPGQYSRPIADVLKVYALLINVHRDNPAPLYVTEIADLNFINSYTFNNDMSDSAALRNELLRLYEQNRGNQYSGFFLAEAAERFNAGAGSEEVCKLIDEYCATYPDSPLLDMVADQGKRLCLPAVEVRYPTVVALNKPFDLPVKSTNASSIVVEMYDITGKVGRNESYYSGKLTGNPVDSKVVTISEAAPFTVNQSVALTCPAYGLYAIRLKVNGEATNGHYQIVRCTNMAIQTVACEQARSAWVADVVSGEPIQAAEVYFTKWSRRDAQTPMRLGDTDNDGEVELKNSDSGSVWAVKGEDRYGESAGVSGLTSRRTATDRLRVNLFTSLGLYRPGDELDFSLVAYTYNDKSRNIAGERRLGVELRNANYEPIDTVVIVTDQWGRAQGRFKLPTSGLTGRFMLRAGAYDLSKKIIEGNGSVDFMVSDYKLPTFELRTDKVKRPASLQDGASVEGSAITYSGFPVANAAVKATLKVRQGFWFWSSVSEPFFTAETVTDATGQFTVEIPASVIAGSPAPQGQFICTIDVTSEAGETHQLEATFNMGKPLYLQASIPAIINLDAPFKADVQAVDTNNKPTSIEVQYTVKSETTDNPVASGKTMTGSVADIIAKLPIGSYTIEFTPIDNELADKTSATSFIAYRPTENICPVDTALWVPCRSLTADEEGNVKIPVGSGKDNVYVRVIVATYGHGVVEKRWVKLTKGISSVSIKMPAGAEIATVQFAAVYDLVAYNYEVEARAASTNKAIKVEIESFRDRVTPGQNERITFRVKPTGDTQAESALFLDMSSKAIDMLASNPIALPAFTPSTAYVGRQGWNFGKSSTDYRSSFKYLNDFKLVSPEFEFYNQSFVGGGNVHFKTASMRVSGRGMMYATTSLAAGGVMDYDAVATTEAAAMEVAEDSMDNGVVAEAKLADGDNGDNDGVYRPSEVPLAFFRPMLTTAADGSLDISYEVPNANTTWILRAMAYNKELLTASTSAQIVASKPLMVEENAPRYLRTADRVTLLSTIMNNSDSLQRITVTSELVSASTGKLVTDSVAVIDLEPMSSATATLMGMAPVGETGLIYRVKAATDEYTDGEQSLLPIMPSEQDIVESEIFYIPPYQQSFTVDLPAMADGDRAYLNFTENPAWQVVSALPGLRESKVNSSVEASASLFSAAVADGLLRDYPELARVVRKWSENPADSALVSELQKNQELKTMLLSATPWISEALSDTQRMQRLALLFDKRQTKAVISAAIEQLANMKADGGWTWSEKYPVASRWATAVILNELGQLNRMGWLPSDSRLQKMIKDAVEYFDRQAAKDYQQSPKADYWQYVIIRDMFPAIKTSTAASRVVEAQIQRALSQWKGSSVVMKGIYAQILNNHGYATTARLVLESLREYATTTPEKGMWWQQLDRGFNLWSYNRVGASALILDAFHSVEPNSEDVEKIRQWLILNKTNNDWGSAVVTTQVIASILTSGKPLTVNPRGTAIHIGDELLEPASTEYATGSFTRQITSMLREPQVMTIDRQANYPSVGGVVTMRRLPMDSISEVSCQEISIAKSLSVFDGTVCQPTSDFQLGDRVRVELTLTVEDDLSYVVISDERAAGFEPAEQLPAPISAEGLWFYRENRDAQTNIFIDFLPRGTYRLAYELLASQSGEFASGVAMVQSQYNPIVTAHSAGALIRIN